MSQVREQRAWYLYDWANSAFASTVLTLFLGPYLTSLARAAAGEAGRVFPLGIPIEPRSWWSYLVSLSVILQVVTLPLIGAAADRSPNKKRLLGVCAFTGATATMLMYTLQGTAYLEGGLLFIVANVSFGAAAVVYNSFLPDIAAPEDRDRVSSRGWGIGYFGGGLVLALNLLLFSNAARIGISEGLAVRISLFSAGAWWALWTVPALAGLRTRPARQEGPLVSPFRQLAATLRHMRRYPRTLQFLIAYLLYNDAVQAIIALAAQFASDELKVPQVALTQAILMVQFVAFAGALLFGLVAKHVGAKLAIISCLYIWIGVLLAIYFYVKTTAHFFYMAATVALVMGGTQALSRSLFSRLIPNGHEAEYFGIYEVSDKGTSWMAPLIFGLALQFTGNYRISILTLLAFFIAGLAVLWTVDPVRAEQAAGRYTDGNGHAVGSHSHS